ncbi:PREDICTED: replication protein A 70 kDa DNA-binding subunit B-like isoform X3 [Ipomoea nil]|uniref:replication protein A 70 kDa DNA-binding subunit B-like isoform X3 n=1 Tax=Ipomoea nil TaxID=35883 RepID=UPI0009012002|nr:PREDICTED: replication protein A 70 kDa DNA-binding subunit B-like isoform X3 [Ipomoea nil]
MVRRLLISDVSPGEQDWSCKVCVVNKLDAQESKTTPGNKYRPIILQDEAGYKVQAMTYANEIDILDNKLSLNATYIITDTIVSIPRGKLVLPDERYNYLWTLTRKCTVADVPDDDGLQVMQEPKIDEISFSHFHKYINTEQKISAMAVVIHKLPRKHIDSKNRKIDAADIVLVDEQAKPVIFTLWGKYAKGERIELEKQLAAGLSLTTQYGSVIDFDIATPKAEQLGQWALSNSVTLHSLILTNAFNDAYLKLADLSKEPFVTISNVKSSSIEGKRYCIYASIKISTKVKNFYYIACDGCWKGTAHSLGDEFECSHCGTLKSNCKTKVYDEH